MSEQTNEFHLYRVTVHATRETLFATRAQLEDKAGLLRRAVMERPVAARWTIGNIADVGDCALYFRVWRAKKMLFAQADHRGNVVEKELESAPNAHVLLDLELQVAAIAKSPKLAPEPNSIARRLARILTESEAAKKAFVEVEVSPLKDPQEFLERLNRSYRVYSLWVEEPRPNPFDVKGLAKNLTATVETFRADKVKARWTGDNLDVTAPEVEELIRTTSTAGGNAGARVQEKERAPGAIAISLQSKLAKFRFTVDLDVDTGRSSLLSEVHDMYRRLRDRDE